MKFKFPVFLGCFFLLFAHTLQAKIELAPGSWANRTMIDNNHANPQAHLNFTYEGCDPSPSGSKINLRVTGCKSGGAYNLGTEGNKIVLAGTVGEITASYDNEEKCSHPKKQEIAATKSLKDLYKKLEDSKCKPSHILIRDSSSKNFRSVHVNANSQALCKLPATRVKKSGFPTEDMNLLHLSATDESLKLGDHTEFKYEHENRRWCINYTQTSGDIVKNCGAFPSPVPIMYKKKGEDTHVVTGIIQLGKDGKATINALNKKEYANSDAVFRAQTNGEFQKMVDKSKGHLEFHTWRGLNSKIARSIVRAYDGNGKHLRSLNISKRNLFGREVTKLWCSEEHCFIGVEKPPLAQNKCKSNPEIDMDKGGSGNVCNSCNGITPGLCASGSEGAKALKDLLGEEEGFTIEESGEYKIGNNLTPFKKKLAKIRNAPDKQGCFNGHAPENQNLFNPKPGENDGSMDYLERAINSQ